jgi:hypothetical protein
MSALNPTRFPERLVALAALAILAGTTPSEAFVLCPFRALTDLPCLFCGITRGVSALLHGDWHSALELHALSPVAVAALAWIVLTGSVPARALKPAAILVALYGVGRLACGIASRMNLSMSFFSF